MIAPALSSGNVAVITGGASGSASPPPSASPPRHEDVLADLPGARLWTPRDHAAVAAGAARSWRVPTDVSAGTRAAAA